MVFYILRAPLNGVLYTARTIVASTLRQNTSMHEVQPGAVPRFAASAASTPQRVGPISMAGVPAERGRIWVAEGQQSGVAKVRCRGVLYNARTIKWCFI